MRERRGSGSVRRTAAERTGAQLPRPPPPCATAGVSSAASENMGLEKEKSDTSIIMDEDEFNRSIEPILSKKGKLYSAPPDRDPSDINAQLKVKSLCGMAL